jgi:hypothetical protein
MSAVVAIIAFCLGCVVGGVFVISIAGLAEVLGDLDDEYFSNSGSGVDENDSGKDSKTP